MLDFNCYIGSWPFHPLAVETFDELKAIEKQRGYRAGWAYKMAKLKGIPIRKV